MFDPTSEESSEQFNFMHITALARILKISPKELNEAAKDRDAHEKYMKEMTVDLIDSILKGLANASKPKKVKAKKGK